MDEICIFDQGGYYSFCTLDQKCVLMPYFLRGSDKPGFYKLVDINETNTRIMDPSIDNAIRKLAECHREMG